MDTNILACEYGISQLAELSETDYRIDLNQGMDARLVNARIANIIARVKWIRFIRFSCDKKEQLEAISNAAALLMERGIKPYRIFTYLLVTEDLKNAAYRVQRLKQLGVNIYAQAERNEKLGLRPNAAQLEFAQRYVYSGCYKKETWPEYRKRKSI